MAVVRIASPPPLVLPPAPHSGIVLPPKVPNAQAFFDDWNIQCAGGIQSEEIAEHYNKILSGGRHSYSDRTVSIYIEGNTNECMAIGAHTNTKVQEIMDLIGHICQKDPSTVTVKRKLGNRTVLQQAGEECASTVIIGGVRNFRPQPRQYPHQLFVLGAGLGGMQTMIDMQMNGRKDFVCMERHSDFGGHSWIAVSNKFTKLQTEKGTYHVDYIRPECKVPKNFSEMEYQTWPSRDQLLRMFRECARDHGLYDKVKFNHSLEKVVPKGVTAPGTGVYVIQYVPVAEEDGDGGLLFTSCVTAWPGNFCNANHIEFPGEEGEFGGYVETCSFDRVDYSKCEGKEVILYGHGAFAIENVRTLVEHRVKKVIVMCRKRNLSGMKICSWLVGQSEVPVPGMVMLDVFQRMYDLVSFNVWKAHAVQTDAKRTFAQITQKTVFGVTDIYFLAGYFGLMEVLVDEIKRLTNHCAHTKKMRKIPCEVVLKAIGTSPSFKADKYLGVKEMVGLWANGDPLRGISCNAMFVQARNFGSFSSGPGFASTVKTLNWFLDWPESWYAVVNDLPRRRADDRPAYVLDALYFSPMQSALNTNLPELAAITGHIEALKARKHKEAHPLEEFLPQCVTEWEAYCKYFRKHSMVDDRPDPPYPYTLDMMHMYVDKSNRVAVGLDTYEPEDPRNFDAD